MKGLFIPVMPPPFAKVHEPPLGPYWKFPLPKTGVSKLEFATFNGTEPALLASNLKLSYFAAPGLPLPVPQAPAKRSKRKDVNEKPGVTVLRTIHTLSLALVSK